MAVGAAALAAGPARTAATERIITPSAHQLAELMARLRRAPRRRDFKAVPMILTHPDLWDDEALKEVIAYRGTPKQVWDNTDVASPWLNLMRNSINAQVFSFGHKDFLAVSATHARLISRCSTRRCGTSTSSRRLPAPTSRRTR